ncbi:hypothetical protein [Priestia megaterium]|uniref:hypothetical protein n=1 Tax=Priestia megaterium TaxID=1404 RepID=UPI001AE000FC|nr:hypothetical protein [Priestia megaterium]
MIEKSIKEAIKIIENAMKTEYKNRDNLTDMTRNNPDSFCGWCNEVSTFTLRYISVAKKKK